MHVLIDADSDSIADHEVVATRNADGIKVDVALRNLDRTLSTPDCQDLAGKAAGPAGTVATTIAGGRETFSFSFDPNALPGHLASFRWAAFGQAPPDGAAFGPWDVMPDAANPDPGAANPGDRRCDSAKSGVRGAHEGRASRSPIRSLRRPPPAAPGPAPKPVVVLALPGGQPQAGAPATIDAGGTTTAPGTHMVAFEWDMNGDGHVDTNTGTNPIAHVMTGAAAQTVIVHATDSNFNSSTATIVLHPGRSPRAACRRSRSACLRIRAACIRHEGDTIVADPEPSERYWANYVVSLNGVSLVTRDPNATVSFNAADREIVAHGRFRVMLLNAPGGDITFLESGTRASRWPLPSGAGAARRRAGVDHLLRGRAARAPARARTAASSAAAPRCPAASRSSAGSTSASTPTPTRRRSTSNVRVGIPLEVTGRTRLRASAVHRHRPELRVVDPEAQRVEREAERRARAQADAVVTRAACRLDFDVEHRLQRPRVDADADLAGDREAAGDLGALRGLAVCVAVLGDAERRHRRHAPGPGGHRPAEAVLAGLEPGDVAAGGVEAHHAEVAVADDLVVRPRRR